MLLRLSCLMLIGALSLPAMGQIPATQASDVSGLAERRWSVGELAAAEQDFKDRIKRDQRDDAARFALGVTQTFRAVERVAQGLHRHGLRTDRTLGLLGLVGVPLPTVGGATGSEPIRYEDLRNILAGFVADMAAVDRTLAEIQSDDVKLRVKIGLVRLDFDGDGTAREDEQLWKLYVRFNRRAEGLERSTVEDFSIMLDRGDVEWLRAYTHLLSGLAEIVLAMDFRELFEHTAHLFFAKPVTRFEFLQKPPGEPFGYEGIVDLIAYIHLLNFEVAEPQRLAAALQHFQAMSRHSRALWKFVLAETDNDREWIPSPKQNGGVLGIAFTDQMVAGWQDFLVELDDILSGAKLVPFWRDGDKRGVNLRRAFLESKRFDLVLWFQGTGAAPFLEEGPQSCPETWDRFQRIFGGDFIGFALWIN